MHICSKHADGCTYVYLLEHNNHCVHGDFLTCDDSCVIVAEYKGTEVGPMMGVKRM